MTEEGGNEDEEEKAVLILREGEEEGNEDEEVNKAIATNMDYYKLEENQEMVTC